MDTSKKTWTCNSWELVGILSRHVVAALGFRNQCPKDFVDDYYSKDTYEKFYDYNVGTINGQDMWQEVGMEEMFPPSYKRRPGRPKKLRRKGHDEDPNKVRTHTNYCWTRYGVDGHNARSYTSQVVDPGAQK